MPLNMRVSLLLALVCIVDTKSWEATVDFARLLSSQNETVNTTTSPPADENQTSAIDTTSRTATTSTITATETTTVTATETTTVTATETTTVTATETTTFTATETTITTMTTTTTSSTTTSTTTPEAEYMSPGVMCWGNQNRYGWEPRDLPPVRKLYATREHQCAILESGLARCWGPYAHRVPLPEDLGPVIDIKMWGMDEDRMGACAIKEANLTLVCWGSGWEPDLSWVPSQIVEFDVAYQNFDFILCVVDVDRTMHCDPWGTREDFGPLPNIKQLSFHGWYRCALTQANDITCSIGWGSPWEGFPQGAIRTIVTSGDGVCALMEAGHIECSSRISVPSELAESGTQVAELFGGSLYYCARLEGVQNLKCFGERSYIVCPSSPCIPPWIANITAMTAGPQHMCAYGDFSAVADFEIPDIELSQCGQTVRGSAKGYRSIHGSGFKPDVSLRVCAPETGGIILDTCQTGGQVYVSDVSGGSYSSHYCEGSWTHSYLAGDMTAGECALGLLEAEQGDADFAYEVTLHCVNTTTTTTTSVTTITETTTTGTMPYELYVRCWGGLAARGPGGVEIMAPADLFGRSLAMAAGPRHQCIVTESQSVQCWPPGLETPGRGFPRVTDVKIQGSENPSACGITVDQNLICWGDMRPSVPAGVSGVVSLAVGGDGMDKYVCVAFANGTVTCFAGSVGGATESGVLDVPNDLTGVTKVDAGGQSTCALHQDGNVTCWGMIASLGSFNFSWGAATSVSVGQRHACAVMEDGHVKCWGDNTLNQTSAPSWLRSNFVSAGTDYTCAIDPDQSFLPVCWGNTERFGPGPPLVPPHTTEWSWMLSVGDSHVCALSGDSAQVVPYPTEEITCDPITLTGSVSGSTIGATNLLGNEAGDYPLLFCPPESGTYTFDTCGADWDTYIRIYDHLYYSDLGEGSGWERNDDACDYQSRLSVLLQRGYCYYVLVEGYWDREGDFTLNLQCPAQTQTTSNTTTVTATTSTATTSTGTTSTGTTTTETMTTGTTTTETSSTSTATTMSTMTTVSSTTTNTTMTTTTMTSSLTTTSLTTASLTTTSLTSISTTTDTSTTSVTSKTQTTTMTMTMTTISATTSTVSTTTTENIISVVTTTTDSAVPATTTTLAALNMADTMAAAEQAEENLVQDLLATGGVTARTEVPGGVVVASKLTTQANAGQSATVVLDNSVVKVDVPAAVLSTLVPAGDEVVLVLTEFKVPIADSTSGQEVKVQGAVRIEFMAISGNQTRRVNVAGMSEAVEFTLPIPYVPGGLTCAFFDELLKQWSTAGVSLSDKSVDGQPIVCLTTHLSLFGALPPIIVDPFIPSPCSETAGVMGIIVFWCIVGVCVLLFLLGVYTDIQATKNTWPMEYLMIPATSDKQSQSAGVSCCQALSKAFKSGGARMIARERASLVAGKGYCAGPETIAKRVLMKFARRAVGAALRLGDDMVNLVLEDQALRDMLVARKNRIEALGPAAFKEAQTRETDLAKGWRTANNQEDCLVGLHASLCKAMNTVVEAQLPDDPTDDADPVVPVRTQVGYGSRVFLVQNPLGMHMVLDMYLSRKMKSFLFLVHMTCTLLLTAVLLQAVGLFDMSGTCDEEEGDVILGLPMVLVAYIISRFVVFNLKSFRARTFTKVESEGCREWFQQLGSWSFQDGIVICVGLAVIGAGMAVTHLLLAEAGSDGHMGFSIGAFIAVSLDFLLLPMLTAFFPSLLNCICLDTAAIESVSDEFDRDVPVTLNKALGNDPPVPVAPPVADSRNALEQDSPDQEDLPGNDEVPTPSPPNNRIKMSL